MQTKSLDELHSEVTKYRTNAEQRTIGFVFHSEPLVFSDGPRRFTRDWALLELYNNMIDWNTFLGNKVYIGGNLSSTEFRRLMFSQPTDQASYAYPDNGLLQAFGVVQHDEIRQPKHLDIHGEEALLVVKNGMATGTTVGRANGLESFTRTCDSYNMTHTSVEIAILPYGSPPRPFSIKGDSGSIILDRVGRIVALLTSGNDPATDSTDISYGTPYWWLEEQINSNFPGSFLYPVVN